MNAKLRQRLEDINSSFWLRPSLIVFCGILLAELLINFDRWELKVPFFMNVWLYSGGETGARTLLGAVAGSTIGVAGTVFSITIATLTLASSQMGPRLLHNFTQDRGNQTTLGIYLATFSYALIVLRSVRGAEQGAFVPHMAITGAIFLALLCVAMLIYFVNHVASRINFDTVIDLVYEDLHQRVDNLATDTDSSPRIDDANWKAGVPVVHGGSGYIQQLDDHQIADWAEEHGVAVRLNARIGDFVFPGAPLAIVVPGIDGVDKILEQAMVLGAYPTASGDLEYTVEQLVDIAVRALSSGINDPRTANRILDRLGAALCVLATKTLPTGATARNERVVFQRDITTYDGLMDAMLNDIRQSAKGSPTVLIHMVDILRKVVQCEQDPTRRASVRRHIDLVMADGERDIANPSDKASLQRRVNAIRNELGSQP
ncbi:MAG: DUF2254 domain-containing protein [Betaproteobacteria bacterium]